MDKKVCCEQGVLTFCFAITDRNLLRNDVLKLGFQIRPPFWAPTGIAGLAGLPPRVDRWLDTYRPHNHRYVVSRPWRQAHARSVVSSRSLPVGLRCCFIGRRLLRPGMHALLFDFLKCLIGAGQ